MKDPKLFSNAFLYHNSIVFSVFLLLNIFVVTNAVTAQTPPVLNSAADYGLISSDTVFCSDTVNINDQAAIHSPVSSLLVTPNGITTDLDLSFNDAITDMRSAYYDCRIQTGTSIPGTPNPSQIFTTGVYSVTGNFHLKYPIFLNGSNTDIFIFNISDSIIIDTAVAINLIGVNPQNIYFTCGKSFVSHTDLAIPGIFLINEDIHIQAMTLGKKALLCNGKSYFASKATLYSFNSIASSNFQTIYSYSSCGVVKYVQASLPLDKRNPVASLTGPTLPQTLSITIPPNSSIINAFMWFSVEGLDANSSSPLSRPFSLNGTPLSANRIGFIPSGTCWQNTPFGHAGTSGYFCDVTALVTSSGGYQVDGLPQFGINGELNFDADGITLFVIYGQCNVSGNATYMEIQHGLNLNGFNSVSMSIPASPSGITSKEAFMILGDVESSYTAYLLLNGILSPFPVSIPPGMWNFVSTSNISFPPIPASVTFGVSNGFDCNNIIMCGLSYQYSRASCSDLYVNVTSTATCKGGNAGTATAIAGCGQPPYTYLWSNGQTTALATGLSPGTYTVTVTDALPATTTATIVVNQFGTVMVNISDYSKCVNNSDGFILVNANNGTPPYSYLWSNNSTTSAINGVLAGVYTVTVTDAKGCTGTVSKLLYDCCTIDTSIPSFADASDHFVSSDILADPFWAPYLTFGSTPVLTSGYSNYFNATIPGQYFIVNGRLIVDTDIDFYDVELVMGPNAEIVITNNATLRFLRHTYLHSCGVTMWNGISIEGSGNSLLSTQFMTSNLPETFIEDAKKAITSENEGFYDLYNVDFNKNWKGIVVNGQSTVKHASLIVNSRFECYTITSGGRIPALLMDPHTGKISDVGMEINAALDIDIGDGITAGLTNYFDRQSYGIKTNGAGATINNNQFKNIVYYGIRGDGQLATPHKVLTVGSIHNFDFNTFSDSRGGIQFVNDISGFIRNNLFNNIKLTGAGNGAVNACIKGKDLFVTQFEITDNSMNNFDNGIYIENFTKASVRILNNVIYNSLSGPLGRHGIYLANPLSGYLTNPNVYEIDGNTVSNNRYNIRLVNTSDAKIHNLNTLYYDFTSGQTPALLYYGIKLDNCTQIHVQENTIENTGPEPTPAFDNSLWGINLSTASGNYILCNTLTNLGTAIRFSNTGINTVLFNHMNHHRLGVVMASSTIGNQGSTNQAQDNQWVHNTTSPGFDLQALGTTPTYSETWYMQQIGLPFEPAPNDMDPTGFISDQSGSSNPFCQAPLRPDEQERMAAIVREEGDYALLPDEEKYNMKEGVYIQLDADSSWMNMGTGNDADLQNFYTDAVASTMGQLAQVRKELISGQNQLASMLISSITPENLSEENDVTVKGIYLATFAREIYDLDSNQYETLYNIAIQNPISGGRSVYTARYMINLDVDDLASENTGQRIIQGHPFSAQPYHKPVLFPNPANDRVSIDIRLADQESGTVAIFDSQGNLVYKTVLHEQQNKFTILLSNFSSGIYLVKYNNNNSFTLTDKLIINK